MFQENLLHVMRGCRLYPLQLTVSDMSSTYKLWCEKLLITLDLSLLKYKDS